MEVRVGCGGWWAFEGGLVPYSRRFDFVELNASYYHLPPVERVRRWRRAVPEQFEFALKLPRTRPADPAPLLEVLYTLSVRYGVVHRTSPWWVEALELLHDQGYVPVLERRGPLPREEPLPPWVLVAEDPSAPVPGPEGPGNDRYVRVFGTPRGVAHHLGAGMVERVATTVRERPLPPKARVRIVIHSYQMYDDAERVRKVLGEGPVHG